MNVNKLLSELKKDYELTISSLEGYKFCTIHRVNLTRDLINYLVSRLTDHAMEVGK